MTGGRNEGTRNGKTDEENAWVKEEKKYELVTKGRQGKRYERKKKKTGAYEWVEETNFGTKGKKIIAKLSEHEIWRIRERKLSQKKKN